MILYNDDNNYNILNEYLINKLFLSKQKWNETFYDELTKDCVNIIISVYDAMGVNIDVYKFYNIYFKFDDYGDLVKLVCDNIICALWFIGIFPQDPNMILLTNKLEFNNKIYSFNYKTKKLNIKNITINE